MERNNPKIFQKNHDEKYEEKKAQKSLSQNSSFVLRYKEIL